MKDLLSLSLIVENQQLFILDQQTLPDAENWVLVESPDHMVNIIKNLKVRGAPLIGVAAAVSLAIFTAQNSTNPQKVLEAYQALRASRPTAVNLMNALDQFLLLIRKEAIDVDAVVALAERLFDEDVELCERMAEHGAELIEDGDAILTHCNTGGLATVGCGTALGVIKKAHSQGKSIHVYVDETRPLLQGGRLTTWELEKAGIPYTLICDNMAGYLMQQGKVDKVFVGSDRIAKNGDLANKIGTYSLAVLAHFHKVPFFGVAPYTTMDESIADGAQIPIEERQEAEVKGFLLNAELQRFAPKASRAYNPAFDVVPVSLLTGIVMEKGVLGENDFGNGN